jgi:hypothetical protein
VGLSGSCFTGRHKLEVGQLTVGSSHEPLGVMLRNAPSPTRNPPGMGFASNYSFGLGTQCVVLVASANPDSDQEAWSRTGSVKNVVSGLESNGPNEGKSYSIFESESSLG